MTRGRGSPGVDAKLRAKVRSLIFCFPIYKHASARAGRSERLRAFVRATRGEDDVGRRIERARQKKRERERKSVKRWPLFRRISCVGSLYTSDCIPPHPLSAYVTREHIMRTLRAPNARPSSSLFLSLSSSFRLCLIVGPTGRREQRRPTLETSFAC